MTRRQLIALLGGAIVARPLAARAQQAATPVVQSTKIELVINVSTASMFGLTVPASLFSTADEVIE